MEATGEEEQAIESLLVDETVLAVDAAAELVVLGKLSEVEVT